MVMLMVQICDVQLDRRDNSSFNVRVMTVAPFQRIQPLGKPSTKKSCWTDQRRCLLD